jgi:hypothetical protein
VGKADNLLVAFAWVVGAGGAAAVGLPVTWAGEELAGAAQRWFRRIRRTDDLSRLVRAATGTSVDLTRTEFDDVRRLLEDKQTWTVLGRGTDEDLAGLTNRIAACLPPGDGRAPADAQAAAQTIARGLLEFAVADLEPKLFQQLLLARLGRMERNEADALDEALLGLHADLVARLAPQGELDAQRYNDVIGHLKRVLDRLPQGPAADPGLLLHRRRPAAVAGIPARPLRQSADAHAHRPVARWQRPPAGPRHLPGHAPCLGLVGHIQPSPLRHRELG